MQNACLVCSCSPQATGLGTLIVLVSDMAWTPAYSPSNMAYLLRADFTKYFVSVNMSTIIEVVAPPPPLPIPLPSATNVTGFPKASDTALDIVSVGVMFLLASLAFFPLFGPNELVAIAPSAEAEGVKTKDNVSWKWNVCSNAKNHNARYILSTRVVRATGRGDSSSTSICG